MLTHVNNLRDAEIAVAWAKSEIGYRTQINMDDPYWYRVLMDRIAERGGCREIYRNENGVPTLYLRRHYIYRGADREIMIHQFFLGDKGPLHDHPAASWGEILQRGYFERLCTGIDAKGMTVGEYDVWRKPGDISYRPGSLSTHDNFDGFHKVKLSNPVKDAGEVITLFGMEQRNRHSWGFRDNDGVFRYFDEMNKLEKTEKVQSSPDDYNYGWFPTRKAA